MADQQNVVAVGRENGPADVVRFLRIVEKGKEKSIVFYFCHNFSSSPYHDTGVDDDSRLILADVIAHEAALCVDEGQLGVADPGAIVRRAGTVLVVQPVGQLQLLLVQVAR